MVELSEVINLQGFIPVIIIILFVTIVSKIFMNKLMDVYFKLYYSDEIDKISEEKICQD